MHSVECGVANAKALVAYYSSAYPASRMCQFELAAAFLAAERDGDPRSRVLVVNPEDGPGHIEPIELRDALYQSAVSDDGLRNVARLLAAHLDTLIGTLGDLRPLKRAEWYGPAPLGSTRFVGRSRSMWQVHSALHAADYAPLTGTTGAGIALIRGFAGIGKTLLAEEYALRFGAAYPGGVFWLRAHGFDTARQGRSVLGSDRGRDEQMRSLVESISGESVGPDLTSDQVQGLLRSRITERGQPCLWVVDDLPSGLSADALRRWLAPSPLARTLLTSRSDEYSALAIVVEPGLLSEEEGYELLTARRTPGSTEEEEAALATVQELGRHALAIDVAGSALARSVMWPSFKAFQDALLEPSEDALELAAEFVDELPGGHEPSIATTLLGSIDSLDAAGQDFMLVASMLSTAPIPLQFAERVISSISELDDAAARKQLAHALVQADSQSLTDPVADGPPARVVHSLISRAVRFRARRSARWESVRAAVIRTLLSEVVARTDTQSRGELATWVAHARVLADDPATPQEVSLLEWVGGQEFEGGDLAAACFHQEVVVEARTRLLGPEHLDTLAARHSLAVTLRAQADLPRARAHQEVVLETRTQMLGAEHPDTLSARNNLAATLHAQGDLPGARSHQEKVLEARTRLLGPEHLDTLAAHHSLAATLHAQGDLPGARSHQEAVLEARLRLLGPEHHDTLTARNNLAQTLYGQGDMPRARFEQEAVLEVRNRLLGHEHPDTLSARNNLAVTLCAQGDLAGARSSQEGVLEARTRLLGPEHLNTLTARYNLAATLYAQGDLPGARSHQEVVLNARTRLLGAEHFHTLAARYSLAMTVLGQGDTTMGKTHLKAVLKTRMRVLGPDHPDTLAVRTKLAEIERT